MRTVAVEAPGSTLPVSGNSGSKPGPQCEPAGPQCGPAGPLCGPAGPHANPGIRVCAVIRRFRHNLITGYEITLVSANYPGGNFFPTIPAGPHNRKNRLKFA